METCRVESCVKPVASGGLCHAHIKRRQRLREMCAPVREYGLHPLELLLRARDREREADGDEEWHRARLLVWKHGSLYRRHRSPENVHRGPETPERGR